MVAAQQMMDLPQYNSTLELFFPNNFVAFASLYFARLIIRSPGMVTRLLVGLAVHTAPPPPQRQSEIRSHRH